MADLPGYELARDAALKLLSTKRFSVAGLQARLVERGNEPALAEAVVQRLLELGLLDDEAYATAFVRDGLKLRGHGRWRLARELRLRGVSGDVAELVLEREYPRDAEAEVALTLARQRASRLGGVPVETARRRVGGYLERRGLGAAAVQAALDEVLPWRGGHE